MFARTLRTRKSDSPVAITAQQHDAGPKRAERRRRIELATVADGASGRALGAGERAEELHLTVALGARDPEDLALRDVEVDRPEPVAAQAGDGEEHLPAGRVLVTFREGELERTPDHQRDELLLRHRRRLERPLADPVAQDGDTVGDAQDLRQPVAHVHDPDPGTASLEHEGVEAFDVLQPERRRRLVEE